MRYDDSQPRIDLTEFATWRPGADRFASALGLPVSRNAWESVLHGQAAYALYMQDRLPEAAKAIERAMVHSLGGVWLADLLYVANGELEARDHGRQVQRGALTVETPADDPRSEAWVEAIALTATRVERFLDIQRPPTMCTLLPAGSLAELSTSPHGYMAPKVPYFKICVPCPEADGSDELARGVVHEYVHVADAELSQGQAPRWATEGLAQWAEEELVDGDIEDLVLLPGEYPRLGEIEGLFHSGRSVDEEEMDYAYAAALSAVRYLLDRHGRFGAREFLVQLKDHSEGRAFKAAFGETERAFEKAWHQWLKENPVEVEEGA